MHSCYNEIAVVGLVFDELVKNGVSEKGRNYVWDIARRKFLYMTPELADSFLELKNYGVYKSQIIDREVSLIKMCAKTIANNIGNEPFNLVDIFCGDGTKAIELLKLIPKNLKIRYCPVNVCCYLADKAIENVKNAGFENVVDYKKVLADCDGRTLRDLEQGLKEGDYRRNVILLLGTILASYDINDYLFELSQEMSSEDYLIIGNGIRTGERLAGIEKYGHEKMSSWFMHLMRYLGFNNNDVEYNARFGNSRVEMYYKLKVDKVIKREGKEVTLRAGDEVLVAILYKYFEEELKKFCSMYFSNVEIVTDEDKGYALVMCKK
ncbi:MAG: L-histidine N(alpha)-methyltransferase [Candidatus Pacearchaeota archaeon]|nr:L-histidine N(alpha)-methyltransferase [Candidatus Pacearchaeota archaeon]